MTTSTIFHDTISNALNVDYDDLIPDTHKDVLNGCIGKASLRKEDLAVLYYVVSQFKPKNVVEVGLATGSSAVCNTLAARDTILTYSVVDPFQSQWFGNRGIASLRSCAAPVTKVTLYEDRSYIALPRMHSNGERFDFAFIDSSHMFDETLIEFFYIDKMLSDGGMIVMDDRPWPMVGGVINFLKNNYVHFDADTSHSRLAFFQKKHVDQRKWYDFRSFEIPRSEFYEERIKLYQSEQGSAFQKD